MILKKGVIFSVQNPKKCLQSSVVMASFSSQSSKSDDYTLMANHMQGSVVGGASQRLVKCSVSVGISGHTPHLCSSSASVHVQETKAYDDVMTSNPALI